MKKKFFPAHHFFLILNILCCAFPEEYHGKQKSDENYTGIELVCIDKIESGSTSVFELYLIRESGVKSIVPAENVQWITSDPLIADILLPGEITGNSPGSVIITAVYLNAESSTNLTVTRGVMKGDILLAEVMYDPEGTDTGREFIELVNTSQYTLQLNGFYLIDGNSSSAEFYFPGIPELPAGERMIIAADRLLFFNDYGFYPAYHGLKFTLNNTGEAVFLYKGDGTLFDEIFISGGTSEHPQPGLWGPSGTPSASQGNSVKRINLNDTNTSSDWISGAPDPGE